MDNQDPVVASTTKLLFSSEARKGLFVGLNTAAEAVACTLGPRGRTVLIQRAGSAPVATKDGVTVSRSIRLKDPIARMGAELIKEAASRTNDVAGDGTTTSTVLTQALVAGGLKLLEAGYDPVAVCRGVDVELRRCIDELRTSAKKISTAAEIEQVATVSANGDRHVGELISQAMQRVGADGIITVEDAKGMSTSLDVVEGMQFDRGYLSAYFVNDPDRMRVVYSDALVLVTDKKLSNLRELVPVLERAAQSQRPLLIIADEVEGEALQALVLNRVKLGLKVVAVKAPGYGAHRDEMLADICVMTGTQLVSSKTGVALDKLDVSMLGQAKKIVIDGKCSTLVGTGLTKAAIDARVDELRTQMTDVTLGIDELTKLKMRAARLASGVAVIRVGGSTEIEMIERKYRIEDALNATKAAVEEGIVSGGGIALFNVSNLVDRPVADDRDTQAGIDLVRAACCAPLRRIVTNAGQSADVVFNELLKKRQAGDPSGYNAATQEYVNLIDAGVVDPVKVSRVALEHAASVATTFLSLDAVICEESTND